jgi:hypothetical protein
MYRALMWDPLLAPPWRDEPEHRGPGVLEVEDDVWYVAVFPEERLLEGPYSTRADALEALSRIQHESEDR